MNEKHKIEAKIIELLTARAEGKTICPSEVGRALFPQDWRERMQDIRDVAGELMKRDIVEITQKGKKVQGEYKGPIRLRLTGRFIK